MKRKIIKAVLSALWAAGIFASCKKDGEAKTATFDLNKIKLEEYCIYTNHRAKNGTFKNEKQLYDFKPGNKVDIYTAQTSGGYQYSYTIVNNHLLDIEGTLYIITFDGNGKITAITHPNANYLFERPVFIKKTTTDQLAGKTFTGRYYTQEGADIHNKNLIYKFLSNGKVAAGFDVNNPVRTENYTPIGNIGAAADITGMNNSSEIMVLIDGKLEVNTWNAVANPARLEYGTFIEQ